MLCSQQEWIGIVYYIIAEAHNFLFLSLCQMGLLPANPSPTQNTNQQQNSTQPPSQPRYSYCGTLSSSTCSQCYPVLVHYVDVFN